MPSLISGSRLGPYEILAPIGAGGQGEVYKARDTRLDRTVAVKVLQDRVAGQPEFRERFEREAKLISSLNHPHICALYDVGNHEGADFLVMEYLEGESLESRLAHGALPPDDVLRYAIEIADALDKAHSQGITHRDLKPGNVMLTKSGSKLLDFGLAKVMPGKTPAAGASVLPTAATNLTAQGSILGTLQYMSPEQLEGQEADGRTDIFAFGAVVYEMATGRKAFQGKSQPSLISAIMSFDPPPISTFQKMTPTALDHLVKVCLEKDPADRWQTAHDVLIHLRWIAEGGSQANASTRVIAGSRKKERLAWLAAGITLALATGLGTALIYTRHAPAESAVVRFSIYAPDQTIFESGRGISSAVGGSISPNGRKLAFTARDNSGKTMLWVRAVDSLAAQLLPGTEGASVPFWSPDSRSIAFGAATAKRFSIWNVERIWLLPTSTSPVRSLNPPFRIPSLTPGMSKMDSATTVHGIRTAFPQTVNDSLSLGLNPR